MFRLDLVLDRAEPLLGSGESSLVHGSEHLRFVLQSPKHVVVARVSHPLCLLVFLLLVPNKIKEFLRLKLALSDRLFLLFILLPPSVSNRLLNKLR
jgi:hypothetical protein